MKEYDSKKLYIGDVYYPEWGITQRTVVYQIGDAFYDMRQMTSNFDLTKLGRFLKSPGQRVIYYKDEFTEPGIFYKVKSKLVGETLKPYYENKETFNIKELIIDMVHDYRIDTGMPYLIHYKEELIRDKEERELKKRRDI